MEKLYKYIVMILGVVTFGLLYSCSSDDEANEWNATYVFLQRSDYLITQKSFALMHDASGVKGNSVTIAFVARIQKPVSSDIVVDLSTTFGEANQFGDKVQLSKKQVIIKAGSTSSEEVIADIPDWSFQLENLKKTTFNWNIAVDNIKTKVGNVRISSQLGKIKMPIVKSAYLNVALGLPVEGVIVADRSGWVVAVEDGTRGESPNSLIDGKTNTDIARDGGEGFWITVDFGKSLTLTAVQIKHYSSSYRATEAELYVSDDGIKWVSQSALKTSGSVQTIKFLQPVQTRYLKYDMNSIYNKTVSVTEFNVYAK